MSDVIKWQQSVSSASSGSTYGGPTLGPGWWFLVASMTGTSSSNDAKIQIRFSSNIEDTTHYWGNDDGGAYTSSKSARTINFCKVPAGSTKVPKFYLTLNTITNATAKIVAIKVADV